MKKILLICFMVVFFVVFALSTHAGYARRPLEKNKKNKHGFIVEQVAGNTDRIHLEDGYLYRTVIRTTNGVSVHTVFVEHCVKG